MPHQLTSHDRLELLEKLKSCGRILSATDERASDLTEVLVRCLESDDEHKLDGFLRDVYPLIRKALQS